MPLGLEWPPRAPPLVSGSSGSWYSVQRQWAGIDFVGILYHTVLYPTRIEEAANEAPSIERDCRRRAQEGVPTVRTEDCGLRIAEYMETRVMILDKQRGPATPHFGA